MKSLFKLVRKILRESTLSDYGWQAAIKLDDTIVGTGEYHLDAWMDYAERSIGFVRGEDDPEHAFSAPGEDRMEEGFIDSEGKFYTRQEALAEWRKGFSDKIGNDSVGMKAGTARDWGDSEDLYVKPSEISGV